MWLFAQDASEGHEDGPASYEARIRVRCVAGRASFLQGIEKGPGKGQLRVRRALPEAAPATKTLDQALFWAT